MFACKSTNTDLQYNIRQDLSNNQITLKRWNSNRDGASHADHLHARNRVATCTQDPDNREIYKRLKN